MSLRWKLAILQLAAGLFGWIWMLAAPASVYFFVAALAFDGRWSNLLWSFVVGGVAKWLARGFADSQKRVAYEAEMISGGISPEVVQEAWVSAYAKGAPLPNREQLEAMGGEGK